MTFSLRATLFGFSLCLGLSACASPQQSAPEPTKPATEAPSAVTQPGANMPAVAMLPPERVMRNGLPGPEAPGPERLVGLKAKQIQNMLGQPDFKRRDPPAEIWQYRKDACMLDVFLYDPGTPAGDYQVKYAVARGRSVNTVSGTDCLLDALAK